MRSILEIGVLWFGWCFLAGFSQHQSSGFVDPIDILDYNYKNGDGHRTNSLFSNPTNIKNQMMMLVNDD